MSCLPPLVGPFLQGSSSAHWTDSMSRSKRNCERPSARNGALSTSANSYWPLGLRTRRSRRPTPTWKRRRARVSTGGARWLTCICVTSSARAGDFVHDNMRGGVSRANAVRVTVSFLQFSLWPAPAVDVSDSPSTYRGIPRRRPRIGRATPLGVEPSQVDSPSIQPRDRKSDPELVAS